MSSLLQYTDSQVDEYVNIMKGVSGVRSLRERLSTCMNLSDRASVFMDYLCNLGSLCFRWGGYVGGRKGVGMLLDGVYSFNGKIWEQLDGVKFKIALKSYCTGVLGMSSQEWLRGSNSYMESVRDGSMLSPLRISKSVVGFRNGVYDFTDVGNIVRSEFSEKRDIVGVLDYDYSVDARCPMWNAFLGSILDKRQQLLLQKYLGLGMVDRELMSAKVENSLWLVGPGGAGKSTIMNVVRYVYGDENISSVPLGSLLSGGGENRARFLASVVGKTFNYCGEVQIEDMTRYGDAFKSLCSGESQQVRRIGGNVEERSDIPYLIFNMNRKPRSRNIDNAITRRLLFISFRTAIREDDRDPELESRLKGEAAGIRNWMLDGYRQFVADGYKLEETKESLDETDAWMLENGQTVELFMRKSGCRAYAFTGHAESGRWFPVRILYDRYDRWCTKCGYERDVDLNGMGRELRRIGYLSKRKAEGVSYQVYGGDGIV